MAKKSLEEVKKVFTDRGCVLLESEYKDSKQKLRYKCSCGQECAKILQKFTESSFCRKCISKNQSEKSRHPYDEVKKIFKSKNCVLLETDYKNNRQKLDYQCSCGKKCSKTLNNFKKNLFCAKCTSE
jgi:hypothetical protein